MVEEKSSFPCTGHCFYVIYIPTYTIIFTYIHLITYLATSSTHLNEKQFIYIYISYIYICILIYISFFTSSSFVCLPFPIVTVATSRRLESSGKLWPAKAANGWPAHKKYPLGFAHGFFWEKKTRCKFVGNYEISEISLVWRWKISL